MPCFKLFTTLAKEKIPADFVGKLVPVLSRTLRKSEERFTVVISPDCSVTFGGKHSPAPGAVATLESIGHLGVEENRLIIAEVTSLLEKELGIHPDAFLMSFYDIRGQDIGRNGVTLA